MTRLSWHDVGWASIAVVSCASQGIGQSTPVRPAPRCFAADFRTTVRSAISGYATITDIPGISVGVVVQDKLVLADGVGFANRRQRVPATADTPYNIASVTKVFTATMAMQLVEEGRLDLDAPASRYLPDSVHVPTYAGGAAITVRHLITHTAGFAKNPSNRRNQRIDGPIDPGVSDAYNLPDLYRALATTTLERAPGTEMVYSNYGYALLGHIVERVSGAPYEQVLRTRLLTPLGMRESGITMTSAQSARLAAFYWADDESRTEQSIHARFGGVAGHIGMTSTVRDMAQFVMAHLGTTAAGKNVIAQSVARRMLEPQVRMDTTNRLYRVDMGLGWFREIAIDTRDATPLLWHYGNVDGHASAVFLRPSDGVGVIMLQNVGEDLAAQSTEQISRWLMQRAVDEARRCRN